MKWFEGGIAEAVTASKGKNAVFVVFVEGKDEASKKTTDAINNPEVSAKLQGSGYVAIRIESDTTAHQQFAQIYQIVPVPSLFFIGNSGLPIEVIAGATDSQTLLGRLEVVEAVHAGRLAPAAASSASSAAMITAEAASSAPAERQATTAPSASTTSSVSDEAVTVSSAPAPSSSGSSEKEAAPIEDRVERAKELLEKKRLDKMREEQEEQRRKEIERRKMGKDVQEMKRQQQDQEMKQLQEARRREKEEDAKARQRVLDQIAQDRANRNAQLAAAAAGAPPPQSSASASASTSELSQRSSPRVSDGTARLQFRLPDGSTHTSSFEATSSLGVVRAHLTANVQLPFRSFVLSTTFPRREYREEDNASTLQDLGLVPTAVMLVIPSSGVGVVASARPGGGWGGIPATINDALWAVLSPVFMVLTYLRNRLFGGGPADQGPGSGSSAHPADTSSSSSDARRERRNKRSSTGGTVRRTGSSNVHRLHQNHSSSDDDNNTWNGNSTQQM